MAKKTGNSLGDPTAAAGTPAATAAPQAVKRGFAVKTADGSMHIGKNATYVDDAATGTRTYTTKAGKTLTRTQSAVSPKGTETDNLHLGHLARAPMTDGGTTGKTSVYDATAGTRTNTFVAKSGRKVTRTWGFGTKS